MYCCSAMYKQKTNHSKDWKNLDSNIGSLGNVAPKITKIIKGNGERRGNITCHSEVSLAKPNGQLLALITSCIGDTWHNYGSLSSLSPCLYLASWTIPLFPTSLVAPFLSPFAGFLSTLCLTAGTWKDPVFARSQSLLLFLLYLHSFHWWSHPVL